jgi:hypothetical protein
MANVQVAKPKPETAKVTQTGPQSVSAVSVPSQSKAVSTVPELAKGAMQVNVGPEFVQAFSRAYDQETKALELQNAARQKQYDQLAKVTNAICIAAKADKQIDLARAFSSDKKDANLIGEQIRLALGILVPVIVDGKRRLELNPAIKKFYPSPKDDKNSDEYKRKDTLRTNIQHQLKKCTQAAAGILENNINLAYDEKAGTLRITGPKVSETFGSSDVLLNEKQRQGDTDLKIKPSFQKLSELGAIAHNAEVKKRNQQVVSQPASVGPVDKDTTMRSLCHSFLAGLNRYEGPIEAETRKQIEAVANAIKERLK